LAAKQSFASETVFSHISKLALIDDARRAGFFVMQQPNLPPWAKTVLGLAS
jgi:predicted ABC-type ATPase